MKRVLDCLSVLRSHGMRDPACVTLASHKKCYPSVAPAPSTGHEIPSPQPSPRLTGRGRSHLRTTNQPTTSGCTGLTRAPSVESQRDSVVKPRVARHELPWVYASGAFQPQRVAAV